MGTLKSKRLKLEALAFWNQLRLVMCFHTEPPFAQPWWSDRTSPSFQHYLTPACSSALSGNLSKATMRRSGWPHCLWFGSGDLVKIHSKNDQIPNKTLGQKAAKRTLVCIIEKIPAHHLKRVLQTLRTQKKLTVKWSLWNRLLFSTKCIPQQ